VAVEGTNTKVTISTGGTTRFRPSDTRSRSSSRHAPREWATSNATKPRAAAARRTIGHAAPMMRRRRYEPRHEGAMKKSSPTSAGSSKRSAHHSKARSVGGTVTS